MARSSCVSSVETPAQVASRRMVSIVDVSSICFCTAFDRLPQNYFLISDLSRLLNMPSALISQNLANSGILLTSGPLIDEGQIHIYAKNSIPPATIKSLKRKAKHSS